MTDTPPRRADCARGERFRTSAVRADLAELLAKHHLAGEGAMSGHAAWLLPARAWIRTERS